jgi:hypothetical protein
MAFMNTADHSSSSSLWKDTDSGKAKQLWTTYQQQHDLSAYQGQTVGIDPDSGRVWFGKSIQDVVLQRDAEGLKSPLFFERVGSTTYFRRSGMTCEQNPP